MEALKLKKIPAAITALTLGTTVMAGCSSEHYETINRAEPVAVLDHRYVAEHTMTTTYSCGKDCTYTITTYYPAEYYLTVQQCDKPPAANVGADGCMTAEIYVNEKDFDHPAGDIITVS